MDRLGDATATLGIDEYYAQIAEIVACASTLLAKKYRVIAPDLLGHGESDKMRGDYSVGAFAVLLRDLLDALDVPRVTVIGHSLGGGIAVQFAHQHRQYCKRIVLISSGGFGGDVGRVLRLLSLPGSELVLPVIASRPALLAGNALRVLMRSSNRFHANPSLSNRDDRQAFLRTLRSVVDFRGQAVSALNLLCFTAVLPALVISGYQDRVIPVAHARAAHRTMPNSRLHIMSVFQFPSGTRRMRENQVRSLAEVGTPWRSRGRMSV